MTCRQRTCKHKIKILYDILVYDKKLSSGFADMRLIPLELQPTLNASRRKAR